MMSCIFENRRPFDTIVGLHVACDILKTCYMSHQLQGVQRLSILWPSFAKVILIAMNFVIIGHGERFGGNFALC